MPPSSLIGNNNSDFWRSYNDMKPKAAPKTIIVYVESFDDTGFWRLILDAYETDQLTFDIQPKQREKGKQNVLSKIKEQYLDNVGPYFIGCVDSDYDYLLQSHTLLSKNVNENPYIFQTYTYAVENYLCFSESLHTVVVQSVKLDKKLIEWNSFLSNYSGIIYPLFLWNIFFRKLNDDSVLSFADFCNLVKFSGVIDLQNNCAVVLDRVKAGIDAKVAALAISHTQALPEIDQIAADLALLGVNEQNTYLFIQGHTLKDNVVLMVLKPLDNHLVNESQQRIRDNALHKEQLINDINHYRNSRIDIEVAVNTNTEYKKCFLFKKLQADFDRYITELG